MAVSGFPSAGSVLVRVVVVAFMVSGDGLLAAGLLASVFVAG